jgi:hypothetical protein
MQQLAQQRLVDSLELPRWRAPHGQQVERLHGRKLHDGSAESRTRRFLRELDVAGRVVDLVIPRRAQFLGRHDMRGLVQNPGAQIRIAAR